MASEADFWGRDPATMTSVLPKRVTIIPDETALVETMAVAIKNARALLGTNPVARLSDVDRRAAIAALVAYRAHMEPL